MASPHRKGSIMTEETLDVKHDKVTVSPLRLDITWGGDGRYWRIDGHNVELIQVCWLEVNGSVEMKHLKKSTKYKLEFKIRMKPDAFGWNDSPVYIMAMPGKKAKCIWASVDLSRIKKSEQERSLIPPRLEFTTPESFDDDDRMSFGLFEIWKGRWKGGLVIEDVIISRI